MNLTDKDIKTLKTVSLVSGLFTLLIAVIMLAGFLQLKRIDPLDNPVLVQLKEQFDRDPENKDLQEQIRTLDLMARKAFFTGTWQVRAGSYLMLAGAIIFILAQRVLAASDKIVPSFPGEPSDEKSIKGVKRQWLMVPAVVLFAAALVVSAVMRRNLPQASRVLTAEEVQTFSVGGPQGGGLQSQGQGQAQAQVQGAGISTEGAAGADSPGATTLESVSGITAGGAQGGATGGQTTAVSQTPAGAQGAAAGPAPGTSTSAAPAPGPGQSFPFFRGPGSRGFAEGTGYPTNWDGAAGKGVIWKIKIPKHGYNSPVIWGNRMFITGADKSGEEIYCYNAVDGKLIWTASPRNIPGAPSTPPETTEDTGLAAPTAAVNGEVVCAIFATGNLVAADHNGKILWAKNIGVPDNHYGHSSSLIIYNNLVLVQFDHNKKASLMAFNTRTGEKAWETVRTGAKISWASPVIAKLNGRDQVILTTDPYVAGYDPVTGAEIWRARGVSAEIGPSVGVNSTMVFAGNEFAKLVAIKPGTGDEPVWQDNEFTPEVASLVATEDYLFVATSFGGVACYDTKTGKIIWEHFFDYGFYSSPIIAEGNVYLMDINGVTYIFRATGEFDLVATSPLGEKSVSTPAFANGRLFIRGSQHIYCIGKN